MTETIPHLNIEILESGIVRLENESMGDSYVVDLHPIHLRYIAEKMGLVREMSASEADALRMAEKLARRLRLLRQRIEQLQKWLADAPDIENADITTEYWFNDATLDLASEFVREIDEAGGFVTPRHAESRDVTPRAAAVSRDTAGTEPRVNPAGTQRVTETAQLFAGDAA